MSSNPLINDNEQLVAKEGEWRGLAKLLRAFADGEPEEAVDQVDVTAEEMARRYADFVDPDTEFPTYHPATE